MARKIKKVVKTTAKKIIKSAPEKVEEVKEVQRLCRCGQHLQFVKPDSQNGYSLYECNCGKRYCIKE